MVFMGVGSISGYWVTAHTIYCEDVAIGSDQMGHDEEPMKESL